ncbi:MAG: YfiR family protein [Pseudomonadota bacterium]
MALLFLAWGQWARAADADMGLEERRLKVALIYNFSQFIEWPAAALGAADAPFQICVLGPDPFGATLLAVQKRSLQGHPILVSHPQNLDEARHCHILYSDQLRGRDVARALADATVLTVSSSPNAAEEGIGIGFVQQADRIRWNMNLAAVRHAQLKVSAKLIEIAVTVVGERVK